MNRKLLVAAAAAAAVVLSASTLSACDETLPTGCVLRNRNEDYGVTLHQQGYVYDWPSESWWYPPPPAGPGGAYGFSITDTDWVFTTLRCAESLGGQP